MCKKMLDFGAVLHASCELHARLAPRALSKGKGPLKLAETNSYRQWRSPRYVRIHETN